MIAKYRPAVPIVVGVVPRSARQAIGFNEMELRGKQVARQLMLTRGLIPTVVRPPADHKVSEDEKDGAGGGEAVRDGDGAVREEADALSPGG